MGLVHIKVFFFFYWTG